MSNLNKEKSLYDTDGRLGESIDLAQASLYQMGARVLQHISGADKEYWSKLANATTGQEWADFEAGVSSKTRSEFQQNTQHVSDLIEKGDYSGAAIEAFTNIDRYLAESLPQMGLMAAGGAVVAMTAPASIPLIGGGLAYKGVKALAAALPAGLDKTLIDIEEFKKNNGREMTPLEAAKTLAITTATLVPEQLLLGMFGSQTKNLVTKIFDRVLHRGTVKTLPSTAEIIAQGGKNIAKATITESGQEGLEEVTDNWLTQNQKNPKSIIDFINTPETKTATMIGGVMGGTLFGF